MILQTKLIIAVLFFLLLGGFFFLERVFISPEESLPDDEPSPEEIPENLFREVQISYYGHDGKYKIDTDMTEVVQKTGTDVNFTGLIAELKEAGQLMQRLNAQEGWLANNQGVLRLIGPVVIKNQDYQLSMNELDLDLNQGLFTAQGEINFTANRVQITAEKLDADFRLTKIHFSGRPRLRIQRSD